MINYDKLHKFLQILLIGVIIVICIIVPYDRILAGCLAMIISFLQFVIILAIIQLILQIIFAIIELIIYRNHTPISLISIIPPHYNKYNSSNTSLKYCRIG